MRYDYQSAVGDWLLTETIHRGRRLCSDEYAAANGEDLVQVFSALRILQAAGCPPDKCKGNPETGFVGKYQPIGSNSKVSVFVLKTKPSGWRLYFHMPDREEKRIEFLHSVHKKKNARDPKDFDRCCRVLDKIWGGRTEWAPLEIPDR